LPSANLGNSNTPRGPFQTTVFAFLIKIQIAMVFGPISKPISSEGIDVISRTFFSVSGSNALAV
jgi:hypothetical protein